MAIITKRGGGWFAQVRRKGNAAHYKTFQRKADAAAWARQQEGSMDSGAMRGQLGLRGTTLRAVIGRYLVEITPTKRIEETERLRLGKLQRDPLCDLDLASLSPLAIAVYRDRRPPSAASCLSFITHLMLPEANGAIRCSRTQSDW